jgi:hypothetical protein
MTQRKQLPHLQHFFLMGIIFFRVHLPLANLSVNNSSHNSQSLQKTININLLSQNIDLDYPPPKMEKPCCKQTARLSYR